VLFAATGRACLAVGRPAKKIHGLKGPGGKVLAGRKPAAPLRLAGTSQTRQAQRAFEAGKEYAPPHNTRLSLSLIS
jgi:hypothetical protein